MAKPIDGMAVSAGPTPATPTKSMAWEPRTIPAIAGSAPARPPRAAAAMTATLLGPGVMADTLTKAATPRAVLRFTLGRPPKQCKNTSLLLFGDGPAPIAA